MSNNFKLGFSYTEARCVKEFYILEFSATKNIEKITYKNLLYFLIHIPIDNGFKDLGALEASDRFVQLLLLIIFGHKDELPKYCTTHLLYKILYSVQETVNLKLKRLINNNGGCFYEQL